MSLHSKTVYFAACGAAHVSAWQKRINFGAGPQRTWGLDGFGSNSRLRDHCVMNWLQRPFQPVPSACLNKAWTEACVGSGLVALRELARHEVGLKVSCLLVQVARVACPKNGDLPNQVRAQFQLAHMRHARRFGIRDLLRVTGYHLPLQQQVGSKHMHGACY